MTRVARQVQQLWGRSPIRERLIPVRKLRQLLAQDHRELALTATQDVERPAAEVLATDILPTADALLYLEKNAARILGPKRLSRRVRPLWLYGGREQVNRVPWGVVGVIGTWNYPILLNVVPIVQALIAGNAVVWKPSELAPTVANKLAGLFREAGFPEHLLTVLPPTREAGPELVEADIDHLVFTGSVGAGRKIAVRLAERLIPSTLELSGCDAMIVLADADLDLAARAAWHGATLNRGQTCLAVRRVLAERGAYPALLDALRKHAPSLRPEPLALWPQAEQAERLTRDAMQHGAKLIAGETPTAANDPPRFPPTMLFDTTPDMALCQEASFAPVAGVMPFDDIEDGLTKWAGSEFRLSASIFTRDAAKAEAWAARLPVSTVVVNDVIMPTVHPAVAFGGRKQAGWGVTRGEEGLLAMTTPQAVLTRKGTFRPHYDGPDSPGTAEILKGLLEWKHAGRLGDRWAGFWKMVGGVRERMRGGCQKAPPQ